MSTATIYTYSILYSSTEEFKDAIPYMTAILEKPGGERFAALVEGWKEGVKVSIGQTVRNTGTDDKGRASYTL